MFSAAVVLAAGMFLAVCAAPAVAQFKDGEVGGAKLGVAQAHKWQVGVKVAAVGGPCKGIVGYVPVPTEWPEQTVKVAAQEVSPGVKISYQTLDEGVRIMVVHIPLIQTNEELKALMTFEVTRSMQLPPPDPAAFVLPEGKQLGAEIRRYLGASPKIEIGDPKIRKAAKEVGASQEKAWQRVEALYDWVRQQVKYKTGDPLRGAAGALKEGVGGHDDMTSLFVAVCRAAGIPARTVWVPEFSYAEFYLVDKKGEGHWIPCAPAGTRTFGEMPDTKPILMKGDNFRPPYNNRERQRFLKEFLTGTPARNGGQPRVQFVRQMVN
jgi:hypothetical protein